LKSPVRLVLASQSPRRKAILHFAGIPFRPVKPSGVLERRHRGENPSQMVVRLALEKAQAVAKRFPNAWVLGADTVVLCREKLFGKPRSYSQALWMLQNLEGTYHQVWTGVALVKKEGNLIRTHVEQTRVFFRILSTEEKRQYLKSREPYDKAGAYDIQGTARHWIKKWEGDYFNVMGLPLGWVVEETNRLFIRPKSF
jgi:septum formation protein